MSSYGWLNSRVVRKDMIQLANVSMLETKLCQVVVYFSVEAAQSRGESRLVQSGIQIFFNFQAYIIFKIN